MRLARRAALLGAVLLAAWPFLPPRGNADPGPPRAPSDGLGAVPRFRDAGRQLRHATDRKVALRGLRGPALDAARGVAVQAYRAVADYFPESPETGSEACFRAGELLRAAGEGAAAAEAFERAHSLGARTPFRGRAAIALGRLVLERDPESALEYLERAFLDPDTPHDVRDEAGLWYAHAQDRLGRRSDARRLWERVARTARDPKDRVRAFDKIAQSWIDEGDPEAAAGALHEMREVLAERLREESENGERLREAVERLRSFARLRAAVKARWITRSDDDAVSGETRGK